MRRARGRTLATDAIQAAITQLHVSYKGMGQGFSQFEVTIDGRALDVTRLHGLAQRRVAPRVEVLEQQVLPDQPVLPESPVLQEQRESQVQLGLPESPVLQELPEARVLPEPEELEPQEPRE